MNKIILTFFLVSASTALFAQTEDNGVSKSWKHDIGVGYGLDYGGYGIRYTYMPWTKWGAFGSVGYMIAGTGYNFGVVYKSTLAERISTYASLMYGTNDATGDLIDEDGVNKIYYGASMGFGLTLKTKKKKDFWNIEFVIPITGTIANSTSDHYFVAPVGVSFGYHFGF